MKKEEICIVLQYVLCWLGFLSINHNFWAVYNFGSTQMSICDICFAIQCVLQKSSVLFHIEENTLEFQNLSLYV